MKRTVQYVFAGNNGKPVYVHGHLTDEHSMTPAGQLMLEVVSSEPEPRPKPGLYRSKDLPGGWIRLVPDKEVTKEQDEAIVRAAREAGFVVKS